MFGRHWDAPKSRIDICLPNVGSAGRESCKTTDHFEQKVNALSLQTFSGHASVIYSISGFVIDWANLGRSVSLNPLFYNMARSE